MSKVSPFDYVNSICDTKKDIMTDEYMEKQYNSFIINRALSYHIDTVMPANDMNYHHHIDNRLEYSFLINNVRKKKRFAKWAKIQSSDELEIVKKYYGYSNQKAIQALKLLTTPQIEILRQRINLGGKQ